MKFSLIICTYMRSKAVLTLLESVKKQVLYPNEIIIIDGSTDNKTTRIIEENKFENLTYYKVNEADRGLTKQRNFGISKVSENIDIVSFLDDDTVLTDSYFKEIVKTFKGDPTITGVGGQSINENRWKKKEFNKKYNSKFYYELDGYIIKESQRNVIRNFFGLQSDQLPGIMPEFSNGRTYGYPLNGEIHKVDLLIGMSFSFHKKVFKSISFSTYFEGYGLYEDADYSLRALKFGDNLINTNAQLYHYHNPEGRPNKYKYGKMVIRNGWYVWRIKYPNPSLKARFKWNAIAFLLTIIRLVNVISTTKRKEAFTEFVGRNVGWISLIFNKPKLM